MQRSFFSSLRTALFWAGTALVAGCGPEPREDGAERRPSIPVVPFVPAVAALAEGLRPALALVGEGRFEQAREVVQGYRQAADALSYQADFVLGYSHQKQKHYQQARRWFEQVTRAQPDYDPPYHFLGFCLYYLGELDGARAAFERHLRGVPDEGDSHFGLGLIAFEHDDLEEAEQRFARAAELHEAVMASDPARRDRAREVAKARARLGDVHVRRGDWARARDQYEQAVRLWSGHEAVWHKLHQMHLRLGDSERAAQALRLLEQVRAARAEAERGR